MFSKGKINLEIMDFFYFLTATTIIVSLNLSPLIEHNIFKIVFLRDHLRCGALANLISEISNEYLLMRPLMTWGERIIEKNL